MLGENKLTRDIQSEFKYAFYIKTIQILRVVFKDYEFNINLNNLDVKTVFAFFNRIL